MDNPALRLGAILGLANRHGADKVALTDAGSGPVGLGDWIEQLVAESTGKHGSGILPVVVPTPESPNFDPNTADVVLVTSGNEFVFDSLSPSSRFGASVDAPLGAALLLWEYAVPVAGRMIGINPFDQPDVESAKQAARDMLGGDQEPPEPDLTDGTVAVYATPGLLGSDTKGLQGALTALLDQLDPDTGYLAVHGLPGPRARRVPGAGARDARRAYRPPDHVRLGTPLPALDRAVPQGRTRHRRVPADHRRAGR
ncbi:MAG: hypothetical protein WKF83_04515 [Nocardioidaceae bacterium]